MHAGSSTTNPIIMFTNKTHRTMVYRFGKAVWDQFGKAKGLQGLTKIK